MKKVTFLMALAVAAGMASCTAQSPKADLKTDIDSLSYAIGMARTEGLDQYLAQQGIDSTQMSEFLKGFNEGAAKIDKKDVAYMAGLQVGQMVSKQWVEGFNQQIFGNDSTQSISRENLLEAIWKYDYLGDLRTVDVHIRRLREKIERVPSQPEYIFTKWGVGYYFTDKD